VASVPADGAPGPSGENGRSASGARLEAELQTEITTEVTHGPGPPAWRSSRLPRSRAAREILTCNATFRSADGATIDDRRSAIGRPQATDVDRPVRVRVVGLPATWAFTSVEWRLLVLSIVLLPVLLAGCGIMAWPDSGA